MRFPQIPYFDNSWDSVIIDALSPSNFSWVNRGCRYQMLLQAMIKSFNNKALSLPPNKNAILGTVIHKLYELTIKGELKSLADLKYKWEDLIDEKKLELAALYPTLRNASLNDYDKRNSAIRYSLGIIKKQGSAGTNSSKCKVLSEKWMDCSKIGLRGFADKLIIDNNYIDVVDFKSGHVIDENGGIKSEYCIQLQLYAVMCQFLSLGTPRNLSLVDIDGNYHSIPFSSTLSEQLKAEVLEAIKLLNNAITARDFQHHARPEPNTCPYCCYRHVCRFREISADEYYQTVSGIVIEIPSSNMYTLRNEKGDIYHISGIDVYDVDQPNIYQGKRLTFVNITRASREADEFTYKTTENTLVYEQL